MKSIIAIQDGVKVVVLTGLNNLKAATIRRELQSSEENLDMLGNQIMKYRTSSNN